jgi:hypothetical protein
VSQLANDVRVVEASQQDLQRVIDVEVLPKLAELGEQVRALSRRLDRPTGGTKRRTKK